MRRHSAARCQHQRTTGVSRSMSCWRHQSVAHTRRDSCHSPRLGNRGQLQLLSRSIIR